MRTLLFVQRMTLRSLNSIGKYHHYSIDVYSRKGKYRRYTLQVP